MIEFKNVSKVYPNGTVALKNVSFKIERGEFVFVVGSSGSGKSTLLKTIFREELPTKGNVTINDFNLNDMEDSEIPYFRRTMGIVFQDFRLISTMTVYDNVAFAMRVIGASEHEIRKRVPYVLSLVGLSSKARELPEKISGGEQQRAALARALVNNADIIIADEPTGNIDPEMSLDIVNLLNRINENGTTVIMVTHEHELVKKYNHRLICIDDGEIISDIPKGMHKDKITYNKKNEEDLYKQKILSNYARQKKTPPKIDEDIKKMDKEEKTKIIKKALSGQFELENDYSKYLEDGER